MQFRIQRPLTWVAYSVLEVHLDWDATPEQIKQAKDKFIELDREFANVEVDTQSIEELNLLKSTYEVLKDNAAKLQLMLRWYKDTYGDAVFKKMSEEVKNSPAMKSIISHNVE